MVVFADVQALDLFRSQHGTTTFFQSPPAGPPNVPAGSDEVTDYKREMRKGRESKAGRWRPVCDGRMEAADEAEEFQILEGR